MTWDGKLYTEYLESKQYVKLLEYEKNEIQMMSVWDVDWSGFEKLAKAYAVNGYAAADWTC
ncbi:hypothetical protein AGMMS49983_22230 [Clostridia bacterium]|nr:hypothetical protein AGMMS49983_22230 [Clostridia bacterium]